MEWYTDLQPMGRKDAVSLAKALVLAAKPVLQASSSAACSAQQQCRFIHVVTGDGVQTNLAACRRVWKHLSQQCFSRLEYSLVVHVCASHIANLVVQIAVVRKRLPKADCPDKGDALCIAASRYFKHLVPAYAEEFRSNLQQQVVDRFNVTGDLSVCREAPPYELWEHLYGDDIIPSSIQELLNASLKPWQHFSDKAESLGTLRGKLHIALYRAIVQADESPVVTRFWTFGVCIRTLLRIVLLGVDLSVCVGLGS